jgi:predicted dehydrogenase
MIHDFDYARWVAGEVVSVYAKSISQQAPHAPIDHALAILTHADGALSHVEGGWSYPKPMFRTALEIAGSQGLIEHPAASSTPLGIYLHADRQQDSEIAVPTSPLLEDPYATQIQHFYALLSGQETRWRVTAEDGLAALRIALAALQSAQTGRPVSPQEVA